MSRRSTETEQIGFLLACVRHANNNKVDFEQVATECGIVSKGAAAKRFERIQKQHSANHNVNTPEDTPTQIKEEAGTNKKRKLEKQTSYAGYIAEDGNERCEEGARIFEEYLPARKAEEVLEQMAVSSDEPTSFDMMARKTINESMREFRLASWSYFGFGDIKVDESSEGQTKAQESGASTNTGHLGLGGELPNTDMGQVRSDGTGGRDDNDPDKEVIVVSD